ncbi:MAG: PEP-CTERM sorting domain-containing protein [Phycisphaerae bacterium]|nr:PEP-CTERM sorting domain-containing protein [Phycisphaerae bacterium]
MHSFKAKCFCMVLATSLVLVATVSADPVDATFEVRLAPGETDAILDFGQTLELEIWAGLTSDGEIPDVQAWSFFLMLDPADNDVISFNDDFTDYTFPAPIILDSGMDNDPTTGDFDRNVWSPGNTTAVGKGQMEKYASFSVTAIGEGTADYDFIDGGAQRPWLVSLDGGDEANLLMLPSPQIVVTPEPGTGLLALILGALGMVGRHNRRR